MFGGSLDAAGALLSSLQSPGKVQFISYSRLMANVRIMGLCGRASECYGGARGAEMRKASLCYSRCIIHAVLVPLRKTYSCGVSLLWWIIIPDMCLEKQRAADNLKRTTCCLGRRAICRILIHRQSATTTRRSRVYSLPIKHT